MNSRDHHSDDPRECPIRVIVQGPHRALLARLDLSLAQQALFIILLNQILDACSTRVALRHHMHRLHSRKLPRLLNRNDPSMTNSTSST